MTKKLKVLVIEDSEPDYVLLKKALNRIKKVKMEITNIRTGQDGVDYIFKNNDFKNCTTPDIIILDLNLPVKDGIEVLSIIKNDEIYRTIPVIIYSTSEDDTDILNSYSNYANSYIVKTFDIKELFTKIDNFTNYWTETVKLKENKEN
jgi:CheY-like chemotaxis protein